jgi:hypothetical protein
MHMAFWIVRMFAGCQRVFPAGNHDGVDGKFWSWFATFWITVVGYVTDMTVAFGWIFDSGKTTLMDVISGRKTGGTCRGSILVNGNQV